MQDCYEVGASKLNNSVPRINKSGRAFIENIAHVARPFRRLKDLRRLVRRRIVYSKDLIGTTLLIEN